jgi:peptide/nickel transport system substrate-binding protein
VRFGWWQRILGTGLGLLGLVAFGASSVQASSQLVADYASMSQVMVFWDPSDSYSNEIIAMANMYQTLLYYNPKTNSFLPELATSYSESKDSLTWTFHLRHNVRFHDGSLMTSQNVKDSIERTLQRGNGAAYIWDAVKSITTPDKYTVVFHLSTPSPINYAAASPYAAWIFNTAPLKAHGQNWFAKGHEDGTGPYELQSWSTGQPLVLTAFKDYWGGWKGKHYTKLIFQTIESSSTRAQMMQSGQLQFTDELPFQQIQALRSVKSLRVVTTPSFQNLIAFLNTQKAPLNNVLVRRALSEAFPYQQVVKDVMDGYATQSRGPIPAGLWGHDNALPQYQYNLKSAAALLKQADIKPGLSLTLTYTAGDDYESSAAALYKAALAQIGVNLIVKPMPWVAQWNLAKATNPANRQDIFMMYWWPDYANPYSFMLNLFHSEKTVNFALSYYKNPTFDHLIDSANLASGTSIPKAEQLYYKAQQLLYQDAAAIFVFDEKHVRVIPADWKGYYDNPAYTNVVFFYNITP